ncbi:MULTISPECIES: hypothetical protein [Listeria]|uniref:hypothetical protein n=1 Tax=Listeria TaxID=1637 RepID=UPI000B58A279|nr:MULTISPECIES: hypothetical protein [Listeria]
MFSPCYSEFAGNQQTHDIFGTVAKELGKEVVTGIVTIDKLSTNENKPLYYVLLKEGSNYRLKDSFGKSCLDYAKEYSWRNDFITVVEEFESENKQF